MLMMFGALFGSWYFETLYMQHVLGYSPLQAGVAFLPQTLLIAAGAQVTSRLGAQIRPAAAHPRRHAGGGGRVGLAGPDHDRQHVRDRPPRAVRAHRSGHGTGRDADRRGGNGGSAPGGGGTRLRVAQHVAHRGCVHRPRGARHGGGQPHLGGAGRSGGHARLTRRRPSPTAMRSPSRSRPSCCWQPLRSPWPRSPHCGGSTRRVKASEPVRVPALELEEA